MKNRESTTQGQKLKRRQPNKLTAKQKAFADALLANPKMSGTQAAMQTYDTASTMTARALASENLAKPNIMEYLTSHAQEAEYEVFELMKRTSKMAEESPGYASVSLAAAKDILDRVHGKATQRVETTSTAVAINIDLASIS